MQSGDRPLAGRARHQDPRPDGPALPPDRLSADRRAGRRLQGCTCAPRAHADVQGSSHRTKAMTQMPAAGRPKPTRACPIYRPSPQTMEALLLTCPLPQPQRHRTHVLPAQGLQTRRHTIRSSRQKLHGCRLPRCNRQLLVIGLGLSLGFYEWTDEPDGKQPHLFTAADGSPVLAMPGLWDRWPNSVTGEDVLSCTIVVPGAS